MIVSRAPQEWRTPLSRYFLKSINHVKTRYTTLRYDHFERSTTLFHNRLYSLEKYLEIRLYLSYLQKRKETSEILPTSERISPASDYPKYFNGCSELVLT